jgi:1-acyl-sn-glycerol-3-phosphate acyltransferase
MATRRAPLDLGPSMSLLWRAWRTLATLWCFFAFAAGGVILGGISIPLVWLLWRREEDRHRVGRDIVRWSFFLFVWMMRITGVLRLRIEGGEALRRPGNLVLANHPTLIDFVILASVVPQADCVVKGDLVRDWFKRWPVKLAGYIPNHDGETTVAQARRSLDSGNNMIIFPEGTRTPPGRPVKFQKGAAQVAVRIRQNITPVLIQSSPSNLEKGGAWYLAPERTIHIVMRVKEDIPVRPFLSARPDQPALAARDLNDHLQSFFNREVAHAAA